jgi:hypothetical protein
MTNSPPVKNPPEMKDNISLPNQKIIEEKEESQFITQIKVKGKIEGMKLC